MTMFGSVSNEIKRKNFDTNFMLIRGVRKIQIGPLMNDKMLQSSLLEIGINALAHPNSTRLMKYNTAQVSHMRS